MRTAAVGLALLLSLPLSAEQPAPENAALKAATDEFARLRGGGTDPAGPMLARVREQSVQAAQLLTRLKAIGVSALTHDEWITHALLTFEAELMRDAETFF